MAKPITFSNGRSWKTQSEALNHFKQMLNKYAEEETVEDRADHDDLVFLLERYDEVIVEGPSKIGCGISEFFIRMNTGEGWQTRSFWVRRDDGSETDWSYISAVKGKCKTRAAEFYDACRVAVESDLLKAKKDFFNTYADSEGMVICELTQKPMSFADAHLDHAYTTFNQIVLTFRASLKWSREIPDGILTLPKDAQVRTYFVDSKLAEDFKEYHHSVATLRVIHREKNLSMAGTQRKPKIKRPIRIL